MSEPLSDFALMALLASARQGGPLEPLVEALPYARFLGLVVARDAGGLVTTMRFHDDLVGDAGLPALHGGTLAGLLESAALFEVLLDEGTVGLPKTITMTTDYLRSGRPSDTHARARIVRRGRRVAVIEARAHQGEEDAPVAVAVVHLLLDG